MRVRYSLYLPNAGDRERSFFLRKIDTWLSDMPAPVRDAFVRLPEVKYDLRIANMTFMPTPMPEYGNAVVDIELQPMFWDLMGNDIDRYRSSLGFDESWTVEPWTSAPEAR